MSITARIVSFALCIFSFAAKSAPLAPEHAIQRMGFALENLSEFMELCSAEGSPHLTRSTEEHRERLRQYLNNAPPNNIRVVFADRVMRYFVGTGQLKLEVPGSAGASLATPWTVDFEDIAPSAQAGLPFAAAVAKAANYFVNSLSQRLSPSQTNARSELAACIEAEVFRNAEVINGGPALENITLTTFHFSHVSWPSYPKIVLSDGAGFWYLKTQLIGITSPIHDPAKEVESVRGIGITQTRISQQFIPTDRYFILPMHKWSLRVGTTTKAKTVLIPDEYAQITFDKNYDPQSKQYSIIPETIEFKHVQTGLQDVNTLLRFFGLISD